MSRSTEAPLAERAIAPDVREGMGARAGEPRNYVGIVRAIVLVVLGFNLLGDGMADRLGPRRGGAVQ